MAFGNNLRIVTVLLATVFVHPATAVGGEDFSNNLFSDLAPILALFGEQVAKQFMSQSMGWADNIMFAMAPLGIITAIVGAIRVGGPIWLKAVIGRARENNAAAEVELMSSTSHDVCELWNGQSIVRMMGSPPILEIIYLHDLPKKKDRGLYDCGLFTLEEAERCKHLKRLPRSRGFVEVLCSSFLNTERPASDKILEKGQESHGSSQRAPKFKRESPNIFLNLSDRKTRQELRWWAMVGVSLQLGVLVLSGLITYFPSLELKKGGREAVRYAYPFTACGTVILVFGMLICSYVVEQRTVEDVLQVQSNKGHLCWLQRGGEVGDQQFDSFAMFARGSRDSIRTSRLFESSKIDSEHKAPGGLVRNLARLDRLWKSSKELVTNRTSSPHHFFYKAITTIGCFISVIGFVIQFIGFRGMHWSATISQLVATMIMTGVRAWVRRDLALRPKDQKLSLDHELDWIATRIVRDHKRLWPDMKDDDEKLFPDEDDGFWEENCWKWVIVSGMGTDDYNLLLAPQVSDADSVVTVRKRLGSLSNWSGPVSDLAVSVAKVIEAVMNSLCSFSDESHPGAESMYWSVNSGANSKANEKNEQIYLKLTRVGRNGAWKADASEIEAVLSLWLYSVQHKEHGSGILGEPKGNEQLIPEKDWLRHGDAAIRQESLRFLGHCLPSSFRDLTWYMGSQASVISVVKEQTKSDATENDIGGADIISVDNHRVVGFRDTRDIRETGLPTTSVTRSKRNMYELWMSEELLASSSDLSALNNSSETGAIGSSSEISGFGTSSNQLAVFSDHDLELLFAQDLFSTFMWAVAKKMDRVDGETTVHPNEIRKTSSTINWKNFKLENSKLSIALQAFKRAKLGSLEDAYLCIIPPLSRAKKLPDALPVIRHAQKMAEELELVGRWEEAGDIYLSLFQVGKTFHSKQLFSLKTTAVLSEFLALVRNMVKCWKEQLREFEVVNNIKILESKLLNQLKTASQSQLEILSYLYRLQNRDAMTGFPGTPPSLPDRIPDKAEWFNRCGFTPFHPIVLAERSPHIDKELRRRGTEKYVKDVLGWTPLHYVATGRCEREEEYVFAKAERINQDSKNLMGWTALHIAAQSGSVSVAWRILQQGGQLEARGRDGMRPLHCAVEKGRKGMIEWLVGAGADIEVQDNSRMTPLHWAAYSESREIVDILTKGGAKINSRDNHGRIPLHYAAIAGREGFLVALKEEEIIDAKDREGRTPLILGAKAGKEIIVLRLLEMRADIKAEGVNKETALHVAAGAGHEAVVQLLLEKGADIKAEDVNKRTALHVAARAGQKVVVQLLLEKGTDIEARSFRKTRALHEAVKCGHETVVQMLLDNGADIEAQNNMDTTALHIAARRGNEAMVQLLLEKGANIKAHGFCRMTALHEAVVRSSETVLQLLLEKGADIEAQDNKEMTALHLAAGIGSYAVVQLLLEKGANIKAHGFCRMTALHEAVARSSETVMQLLLDNGADIEAQDDRGRTALDMAIEERYEAGVRLLNNTPTSRHTRILYSRGRLSSPLPC